MLEHPLRTLSILLVNSIPFIGVLFWGWQVFPLMLLFWLENIVLGVFNAIKMLFAAGDASSASHDNKEQSFRNTPIKAQISLENIALTLFFCFHYGMFCFVHGVFVFALFASPEGFSNPFGQQGIFIDTLLLLRWALLAIVLHPLIFLIMDYFGKGHYRHTKLIEQMHEPYGRIMILHVTIVFSGYLLMQLGMPSISLVLLIIFKTLVDLGIWKMAGKRDRNSSLTS